MSSPTVNNLNHFSDHVIFGDLFSSNVFQSFHLLATKIDLLLKKNVCMYVCVIIFFTYKDATCQHAKYPVSSTSV